MAKRKTARKRLATKSKNKGTVSKLVSASSRPTVSIVMATFNCSKYLKDCIDSMLSQTFKDFEFIIIDDKSTDDTAKILHEYSIKDKRVKVFRNTENLGLTRSLNKGLDLSHGKYIARMDDDDVCLPERLAVEVKFLEENPEIFLVGTAVMQTDSELRHIGKEHVYKTPEEIKYQLTRHACFRHNTIMFRNDNTKIRYRPKFKYAQDYDLYLRLSSLNKKLANIDECLVLWRVSHGSISYQKRAQQNKFAKKALEFYMQRLSDGKDKYDEWNASTITNYDVNETVDPQELRIETRVSFQSNDFKRARRFARRYFKIHGIFSDVTFYYFMSILPVPLINIFRRIRRSIGNYRGDRNRKQ